MPKALSFASTFSGFGGADIGAERAGLRPLWGIEYEDPIAAVARANDLPTRTADVLTTDFSALTTPFWYHTSPPCPSFSVAKTDAGETQADLALAHAVAESIRQLSPPYVSIENVRGYLHSESFRVLLSTLDSTGYALTYDVLCAADYGTPQTRDRLVLVASRVTAPKLPTPTHAESPGVPDLWGYAPQPWNGWYAAIEDLLPGLPDAELAPWQKKRLPNEWKTLLVGQGGYEGRVATAGPEAPALTVTANTNQTNIKAVLVSSNTAGGDGCPVGPGTEPALTVDTKAERVRALYCQASNANGTPFRDGRRPAATVVATGGHDRALLIQTGNTSDEQAAPGVGCLRAGEPANTVYAQPPAIGAVLTAPRIRTVRLSPRCLARFQDFPDTYVLPETATLACKGIGNAVPSGLMDAVIRANLP